MTVAEAEMLVDIEEGTDAIGRRLGSLAGELARSGLEAAGPRKSIAEQLGEIQRRHAELRAKLWSYAELRRNSGGAAP